MLIDMAAACGGSTAIPLRIPYGDKSIFRDRVDSGGKLHFRDLPARGGDPHFYGFDVQRILLFPVHFPSRSSASSPHCQQNSILCHLCQAYCVY